MESGFMSLREIIIGFLVFSIILIGMAGYGLSVQSKTSLGNETITEKEMGIYTYVKDYSNSSYEKFKDPNKLPFQEYIPGGETLGYISGGLSIIYSSIEFFIGLPIQLGNTLTNILFIPPEISIIIVLIFAIFVIYEILTIFMGREV